MRQQDKTAIIVIAIVSALFSLILASLLFGSPAKHNATVPVVQAIGTSLPDIKNDSSYNSFLNPRALDPSQPVQTGSSQNQSPFNISQ
jgi:hypothetical protein